MLEGLTKISSSMLEHWRLLEASSKVAPEYCRKETVVQFLNADVKKTQVEWWLDTDLVFVNSTCFNEELMKFITERSEKMKPGSFFITFTWRLESDSWEELESNVYYMSWGQATVIIHRKKQPLSVKAPLY